MIFGMQSLLPQHRRAQYAEDAKTMSDRELAKKYRLSDKVATDWRVKLFGRRSRKTKGQEAETP